MWCCERVGHGVVEQVGDLHLQQQRDERQSQRGEQRALVREHDRHRPAKPRLAAVRIDPGPRCARSATRSRSGRTPGWAGPAAALTALLGGDAQPALAALRPAWRAPGTRRARRATAPRPANGSSVPASAWPAISVSRRSTSASASRQHPASVVGQPERRSGGGRSRRDRAGRGPARRGRRRRRSRSGG